MSDLREKLAHAMWQGAVMRAAPNIAQVRTLDAFSEENSETRTKWLGIADVVIAALPGMVQDLVWYDFPGRGAKATAWGEADYLIVRWSNGKFELIESYPGHRCRFADGFYPSLQAAKSAANAHHRAEIMAAMGVKAATAAQYHEDKQYD